MEALRGGIRRVTMPLPTRPGHVHCYLLPAEGSYMLVDTGLGLPDAAELWAEALEGLDAPVSTLFLTHFHPDHLGAARDIRELTGARVVQGRIDAAQSATVWASDVWSEVLAEWFHRNGVPETVTEELIGQGQRVKPFVRWPAEPDVVDAGDMLDGWEVVAAPGHADGQLMLLKDGVLIAGDHLLDRITPSVGLWPASRPDPLGDYLESLRRTIDVEPEVAYGGHGEPIPDPVGRARELLEHHDRRLGLAAAALGPDPSTGYDVSFPLFGDDLRPATRRFAVAETLSHLERLVREGRAERHESAREGNVVGVSYTAPQ